MYRSAMNTTMWRHPVTRKRIQVREEDWAVDEEHDGWIELLRPMEDFGSWRCRIWRNAEVERNCIGH